MKLFGIPARLAAGAAGAAGVAGAALGQEAGGPPRPWQMDFPEPASPVMAEIVGLHDVLLVVIVLIALFVTGLMAYAMIRFRRSANPTPGKTTHHPTLEITWTVIPTLILIAIAVPSFRLLYYAETLPEADLTIKATGASWYWTYEYPDEGIELFALMVEEEDLEEGQPRLLATDAPVVVPVDKVVRMQVTSADVIHAWAVPAFRRQGRRRAGPAQRNLVRRRENRHILRPVFRTLRNQSRLHAHRGEGRGAGRI